MRKVRDILGDKNAQIAALCERFGVSVEDQLADDDPNNVQKAVDSGIGYVEHAVRGRRCLERISAALRCCLVFGT